MTEIQKHIISTDGTKIGYRQSGYGDGLMIAHGTGRISQNYKKLALALARDFTVYTYDRRGRGMSGSLTKDHFPKWILKLLVYAVRYAERNKEEAARMLNLLYTIPADMKIVKQLERATQNFEGVKVPALLMGGTKSQEFFQQSVKFLGEIISGSKTRIFEGFDHYSPEEKVFEISETLREFFDNRNTI